MSGHFGLCRHGCLENRSLVSFHWVRVTLRLMPGLHSVTLRASVHVCCDVTQNASSVYPPLPTQTKTQRAARTWHRLAPKNTLRTNWMGPLGGGGNLAHAKIERQTKDFSFRRELPLCLWEADVSACFAQEATRCWEKCSFRTRVRWRSWVWIIEASEILITASVCRDEGSVGNAASHEPSHAESPADPGSGWEGKSVFAFPA